MKILSIGNSFSQDAQRYLHKISVAAGNPIKAVNLYIGGCSLRTHYFNMLENAKKYAFEFNGESTKIFVTIKEALMSDEWDYVTLQQASPISPYYETYLPYLTELYAYVKKYAPQAKILIHETWAYDKNATVKLQSSKCETAEEMYSKVIPAYEKAAEEINAAGIIRVGEAINEAIIGGLECPYRDGFHLSKGAGRYLAALLWFCYLKDVDPDTVPAIELDEDVTDADKAIITLAIKKILNK